MSRAARSAIAVLERLAARDPVAPEVEHVLAVLHDTEAGAGARLEAVAATCQWTQVEDASLPRRVPLATWADLVVSFLRHGPDAVYAEATNGRAADDRRAIAIAVLGEAADIGGLTALVNSAAEASRRLPLDLLFALTCADALNAVLRNRHLDAAGESTVRSFLHRLFAFAETDNERSSVLLALRWVGDETSVVLLESAPVLQPPWQDVPSVVRRELCRRARRRSGR